MKRGKMRNVLFNNAGVFALWNMHHRRFTLKFFIRALEYLHKENKRLFDERIENRKPNIQAY